MVRLDERIEPKSTIFVIDSKEMQSILCYYH